MSTTTVEVEPKVAETKSVKYVYFFGDNHAEGHGKMKDELGGKGAGLAEMTNAKLPVPPGFTIQTEACREYMRTSDVSAEVNKQMDEALEKLERLQGQKLGGADNPSGPARANEGRIEAGRRRAPALHPFVQFGARAADDGGNGRAVWRSGPGSLRHD